MWGTAEGIMAKEHLVLVRNKRMNKQTNKQTKFLAEVHIH